MKRNIIEAMKTFLSEEDIEFDIDIDDEKLKEIKKDYLLLAEEYTGLFLQFRKNFVDYDKEGRVQVEEIIAKNVIIYLQLNQIMLPLRKDSEYGKFRIEREIKDYVFNNVFLIMDFFDLCLEVYGE